MKIRKIKQGAFVKENDYDHFEIQEVLEFWFSRNKRIKKKEYYIEKSLNLKLIWLTSKF